MSVVPLMHEPYQWLQAIQFFLILGLIEMGVLLAIRTHYARRRPQQPLWSVVEEAVRELLWAYGLHCLFLLSILTVATPNRPTWVLYIPFIIAVGITKQNLQKEETRASITWLLICVVFTPAGWSLYIWIALSLLLLAGRVCIRLIKQFDPSWDKLVSHINRGLH